ncbi:hypothetical protein K501DRAFT_266823 [Backusella circina FSU 941]|nr:hypothetical protein K501DRAFT_266823 [Backusella circina FSU 941]
MNNQLRLENADLKSRVDTLEEQVHVLMKYQKGLENAIKTSDQKKNASQHRSRTIAFQKICDNINKRICSAVAKGLKNKENIWDYSGVFKTDINCPKTAVYVDTIYDILNGDSTIDFPQDDEFTKFLKNVIEVKLYKRFYQYKQHGEPGSSTYLRYQAIKKRKSRKAHQPENEDLDDDELFEMIRSEMTPVELNLFDAKLIFSDDNLMSDYETDEDQPATQEKAIVLRKQPSYRSRQVHSEVISSRRPNRGSGEFLQSVIVRKIQVDEPKDANGKVIMLDDWMLASSEDKRLHSILQDVLDEIQENKDDQDDES